MAGKEELVSRVLWAQQELQRTLAIHRRDPLMSLQLTTQQLKTLLVVAAAPEGSSGHELTAELNVSLATVSGLVDRLASQGLVRRREDPHDRRVRRVLATDQGHELIRNLQEASSGVLRQLFSGLSTTELGQLETLVRRLIDIARKMADSPTPTAEAAEDRSLG
ncbi:MarR family winged helix-turn-helix transcriptional regulator [Goodfellowiella coeruleoviolacea]|uniref:DNA-binding transcriptional regulator, MarR family n=1 Tax=Goodfellowiella coeruleoviolacea TaxID=334858 RepID=A0AAE3GCR7_9PSEU|nr:MarR family transcriptional regulator [Goodfellowiella coeruleoviolacea]MCP2165015.1 DNA-binding transcriptional regulator, MarR family [Goodfellowiella coeruleoviolacea]